ncbi:MAG: SBBP repeat-containing protein [Chitinophagales bacterium]
MKQFFVSLGVLLAFSAGAQQLNQVWVNNYNGAGDYSDKAVDMVTDASGNIYYGGYTTSNGNHDYLTVKLNSSGDTLWTRTYNGTNNSEDEVKAIAVDGSGNVYVTGYASGTFGDDYVTIKYNSSGAQQWVAIYNSAFNEDDVANDVAVDGNGNVYVTGASAQDADALNNDYATVKYNSSGAQQWAVRYDGFGLANDEAKRIILDNAGNPIITGQSDNGSDDDWITQKLNPANGGVSWTNTVDYGKNDRPSDMTIDANNVVYIAGRTKATNYDLAVRKIDASGATVWTKFFQGTDDDRATSIAVDASGNVYVTGITDIDANPLVYDYNFITLKYNSVGTQQWLKTFNGSANGSDESAKVLVNNGFVYVAGQTLSTTTNNDYALLKYDSAGTIVFSKTFDGGVNGDDDGQCLALLNGEPVIGGLAFVTTNNANAVVVKYDGSGNIVWNKGYNGSGDNNDVANRIVVNGDGSAVIAGSSVNYKEDKNFLVSKIDGSGNTAWTKTITGTSGLSPDEAVDVKTDASGNVYATGFVKDSAESYNFCTVKYDAGGTQTWLSKYNKVSESDKAVALGLDGSNNVYVAGRSDVDSTTVTNYDFVIVKYNSNGTQAWAQSANAGNADEAPVAMAVSNAGNVYVTGRTTTVTNDDFLTVKLNNAGAIQWQKQLGFDHDDRNEAVLLDASENLYICGRSEDAANHFNGILVKYNSNGDTLWTRWFPGQNNGAARFDAMAFDSLGNVFVVGNTDPDGDTATVNNDYLVAVYDINGGLLWDTTWSHSSTSADEAKGVSCSGSYMYVTGESNYGSGAAENYNYVTLQYSMQGGELAMAAYDQSGVNDKARAIGTLGTSVYVAGESTGNGTQYDAVVVRYDIVSGLTEVTTQQLNAYPNPFSSSVKVSFTEVQYDAVVQLMDVSGRVMRSYSLNNTNSLTVNRGSLPAGIYFLRLTTEEGRQLGITRIVAE